MGKAHSREYRYRCNTLSNTKQQSRLRGRKTSRSGWDTPKGGRTEIWILWDISTFRYGINEAFNAIFKNVVCGVYKEDNKEKEEKEELAVEKEREEGSSRSLNGCIVY